MEDPEFFDALYQSWSKTTGVEGGCYYAVADRGDTCPPAERFQVYASKADGFSTYVAGFFSEDDADFFAGLHGALPELVRALHDSADEATRKDEANDIAQGLLAEALLENAGLKAEIERLEGQVEDLSWR